MPIGTEPLATSLALNDHQQTVCVTPGPDPVLWDNYIMLFSCYFPYFTVPTFSICTKFAGSHNKIHDHTPDCNQVSWAWMLELNVSSRTIDVLGFFFDMLFIGVCTTRHWQTCCLLVHKLNAFTVDVWAARAWYTTALPIARQFPGHWCMDDLKTEPWPEYCPLYIQKSSLPEFQRLEKLLCGDEDARVGVMIASWLRCWLYRGKDWKKYFRLA